MSIKQISVFVQSKPGHLKRNLDIFKKQALAYEALAAQIPGITVLLALSWMTPNAV